MGKKTLEQLEPVSYQLAYWHGLVDVRLERRKMNDEADKWAIRERRFLLNKQGEWEVEPDPDEIVLFGNETARFLARCWFDTAEEALEFWGEGHKSPYTLRRMGALKQLLAAHPQVRTLLTINKIWPPEKPATFGQLRRI